MEISDSVVTIFTDGACSHNPGPGGWAALLIFRGTARFISGYERHTTNNRMELRAAIGALTTLTKSAEANVHTDSKYLQDGISRWIRGWIKNKWKTSGNKPVLNQDLWLELLSLVETHHVHWSWVRGHSTNKFNNFVDLLARGAISRREGVDVRLSLGELEDILDG